jgi:hypothetical protein
MSKYSTISSTDYPTNAFTVRPANVEANRAASLLADQFPDSFSITPAKFIANFETEFRSIEFAVYPSDDPSYPPTDCHSNIAPYNGAIVASHRAARFIADQFTDCDSFEVPVVPA